jgi:hypothetical protein
MQSIADRPAHSRRGNDVDARTEGGRQLKFFSRTVSSHRSFIVQQQAHFHLRGMNNAHFRGRDKGIENGRRSTYMLSPAP